MRSIRLAANSNASAGGAVASALPKVVAATQMGQR